MSRKKDFKKQETKKISFIMNPEVREKLEAVIHYDKRSIQKELEWLVCERYDKLFEERLK